MLNLQKEIQPICLIFNITRINIKNDRDYRITLERIKPVIREIIEPRIDRHPIKINLNYHPMVKVNGNIKDNAFIFAGEDDSSEVIMVNGEIDDKINEIITRLIRQIENYVSHGSDIVFLHSAWLEIRIARYNPMGSKYFDLPDKIKNTQACINIKNNDEKCGLWCLYAALYPESSHPQLVSKYLKYENDPTKKINTDGIDFPLQIKQI